MNIEELIAIDIGLINLNTQMIQTREEKAYEDIFQRFRREMADIKPTGIRWELWAARGFCFPAYWQSAVKANVTSTPF